jgi:hypothetical protein
MAIGTLRGRAVGVALTLAIVELTLTTSYIHLTLGGVLFTLNAIGCLALAALVLLTSILRVALVERFSWLPRLALFGYTLATIAGYVVIGPYFALGWITKAIELAILTLLVADAARVYGSPAGMLRAALRSLPGNA